ncbi:MAG: chromate efflux transporter [Proteobacteria bacterium]|nr:chromate efflux transporter [Pseudomonadota bacterium]
MAETTTEARSTWREVLGVYLKLGVTSFGGPVAHIGYYRQAFVVERRWIDERTFADLVALCQFLPGPASTQVSIAIGMMRAGLAGGLAAWAGFTLPSALLMLGFAYGVEAIGDTAGAGWLRGLKIVAVAVVAQAVWGMARSFCVGRTRASLALASAIVVLAWPAAGRALGLPEALGQIAAIALGGVAGWLLLEADDGAGGDHAGASVRVGRGLALSSLVAFFGLLVGLPVAAGLIGWHGLALFDSFYRVGSLVFGGGHVVLPLLQAEVVSPGWVSTEGFLAGYGAAQAVPGPLFTFSAYLGAVSGPAPNGVAGGAIALVAIFAPSFLILIGVLPFWDDLRRRAGLKSALSGVNAAVVGLLLAALYTPVFTGAIRGAADAALGLGLFALLAVWRLAPWLVVVAAALAGALLYAF